MPFSCKQEAIIHEIELYVPIRYSLEKAILTLSAVPLLTIFSMILVNAGRDDFGEMNYMVALLYLIAPSLYLFIVYHIVRLHLRIIRIKSYLGYLEDILTSSTRHRDVFSWEREIDIEERYTFVNSALQVPFHIIAFLVLMIAYCKAFDTLHNCGNELITYISLVILALFFFGLLFELYATGMAHWDTKASINKDRARNRLEPLPAYYADNKAYFSIYRLEKKMMNITGKDRRIFGSWLKCADLKQGNTDVKYLVTEALLAVSDHEKLKKLMTQAKERRFAKGHLAVSFASKDTLMLFVESEQQSTCDLGVNYFIGKATLLVPMAIGDEVLIWDPEEYSKKMRKHNLSSQKKQKALDTDVVFVKGTVVKITKCID